MTKTEKDILAHVVVDPDGWYAHAVAVFGAKADDVLKEKIDKYRASYNVSSASAGYKDRATLEAEKPIPKPDEKEILIQEKIRDIAIKALIEEGKLDKDGRIK